MNKKNSSSSSSNLMSASLPASGFQREFAKINNNSNNNTINNGNSNNNNNSNNNQSSSGLTFEKKDFKKSSSSEFASEGSSMQQQQQQQSSSTTRKRIPTRRRNLNLDGSLFWEILSESKQYLQSCTGAQKTICIPPDDEVSYVINTLKYTGAKFQAFMKDHILSNSPLFIGEYITDRGNQVCENSEVYEILAKQKKKNASMASSLGVNSQTTSEEHSTIVNVLQTGKGFNKGFNIFVLKEETCYNDKYQPYKVLFIDKCIADEHQLISIGTFNDYQNAAADNNSGGNSNYYGSNQWNEKRPTTIDEYHQFLQDVNYKAYTDKLKRSIQHFNFNYLILRGFHSSIPDKIMEYYQVIYGEFQQGGSSGLTPDEDKDVKNAIHCVLLEGIYDKLFPFLEKYAYQSEDLNFLHICMSINVACSKNNSENAPPPYDLFDILSIGNGFRCDHSEAITFLTENINLARNPFDKMKCIKSTTDKIVNSISRFNQTNNNNNGKSEFITTDDMIPLLAYVLVRSQIPNMITNFNFMQDYQLEEEHGVSEYGFSVTTLNATIYYLREEIYGKDESKWKPFRKLVETPKKSSTATSATSSPSLKTLDIEPFLNSPVSPLTLLTDSPNLPVVVDSTITSTTTSSINSIDHHNSSSTTVSKPKPSRSFFSFDGNVDTSSMASITSDNLLSNNNKNDHTTVDDQLSSDQLLSGLLSPRDTQRSIALKQRRQEEREKRMSIRKLESIAVIKSFASSSSPSNNPPSNNNSSLSRQNSMPYNLSSRNNNKF